MSILYTSRQINDGANEIFYMNSLLVYINCGRDPIVYDYICHLESILAKEVKTQRSEKHAMKIELLSEGDISSGNGEYHIVVTCNELPALCTGLLLMERDLPGSLSSKELRLVISDKVGPDGARAEDGKAREGHAVSEGYSAGGHPSIEESLPSKNSAIGTTSPRVRRLLEPLRRLHSLIDPQIIGPFPDKYSAEVIADISKPPPSDQDIFDRVLVSCGKGLRKFGSGEFFASITEFRNTLDELEDARDLNKLDEHSEIIAGPHAGLNIWEAYEEVQFTVSTMLIRAYLETGDVDIAENWRTLTVRNYVDNQLPGGHSIVMLFHLKFQIREERERMGVRNRVCRFEYLRGVVGTLREGLWHDPGNALLAQELSKYEPELAREEDVYDLMNIADRLDPKSDTEILEDDWYIPRWIWNQKGQSSARV